MHLATRLSRVEGAAVIMFCVIPEGAAVACAGAEPLTALVTGPRAGAIPLIVTVVPPAAEPVSLQNASGLRVHGGRHPSSYPILTP